MDFDWAMRPELAQSVVSGWLIGIMVGLTCLSIVMIGLSREPLWWERFPEVRVSLPVFGIIAANAMMFGWTLIGVLLGFLHHYLGMPGFAIAFVALAFLGGAGYWIFRADARGMEPRIVWTCLGVVTAAFGIGLPVLAGL